MAKIISLFQEDEALLNLTNPAVLGEITKILSEFWVPPHKIKNRIKDVLTRREGDISFDIIVSGETNNISSYIISSTGVLVITPFSDIEHNVLLREIYGESVLPKDRKWYIFPATETLLHRLSLPRVLLVNPSVIENFPIPRLCLSIGLLGSYLRKYQKAEVHIIDMQVGATIKDIIYKAAKLQPALFGMSISYGQKHVALSILEELYRIRRLGTINPLVVLGNIIPASHPKEFIDLYPDLLVATGEGELTIIGLIEFLNGERELTNVPSLVYRDDSGHIQRTVNVPVPVNTIPLPALDTIEDLARYRGALTLELSRGCQWNVCTFCPREHKSKHWKTFTPDQMLEQFKYMREVCDRFNIRKHIYLADEEFVGGMNKGLETKRITDFAQALLENNVGMQFDAAARVDQVYSPRMNKTWHTKRMEMWYLCRQAGLDRLFMGLESGSVSQLRRFGKGIHPNDSITAIRILSALGIPLRFGFVMFDQLMNGLREIKENIAFLERTDAFMKRLDVTQYSFAKLFDLLVYDSDFVTEHSAGKPIYEGVSYMLATLEVLINSRYKHMLQRAEQQYGKLLVLDEENPDTNMGRYKVQFLDDLVGNISTSSQKWIDRHFGLAYCIKSLYKSAPTRERKILMNWMVNYRRISLLLVKALVYIFDRAEPETELFDRMFSTFKENDVVAHIKDLRLDKRSGYPAYRVHLMEDLMNTLDCLVRHENKRIEALLKSGEITDTKDGSLAQALEKWEENMGAWTLINDPTRFHAHDEVGID